MMGIEQAVKGSYKPCCGERRERIDRHWKDGTNRHWKDGRSIATASRERVKHYRKQ